MIIKLAAIPMVPKVIWNIKNRLARDTAVHHFDKIFSREGNLSKSIAIALGKAKKVGPITQRKEIAKQVIEQTAENIRKAKHPSLF